MGQVFSSSPKKIVILAPFGPNRKSSLAASVLVRGAELSDLVAKNKNDGQCWWQESLREWRPDEPYRHEKFDQLTGFEVGY
jgi:hypothetical protein